MYLIIIFAQNPLFLNFDIYRGKRRCKEKKEDEGEDPENVQTVMVDSDGKEAYAEPCTMNKELKEIPFSVSDMEKFLSGLSYTQRMRWADNFFRNEDPSSYYFASGIIMQYILTP